MSGRKTLSHMSATDWRFNEFPNPAAQALYVTCVEIMALPVPANSVAYNLLDVVLKGFVFHFNSKYKSLHHFEKDTC